MAPKTNFYRILGFIALVINALQSSAQDRSILGFRMNEKFTYPTPEEQERTKRWGDLIRQGDWTPIHEAYTNRNLVLLWQMWYRVRPGSGIGFAKTDEKEGKVGMTQTTSETYAREVRLYVEKLLTQVPGHAKLLADEIDKNPAYLRLHNLRVLESIKSPEAIQQMARFLDDTRGQLTKEQISEVLLEREQHKGTDYPFIGHSQALAHDVVPHLDLALGDESPVKELRKENGGFISDVVKGKAGLKAWWTSPASAKYHRLLETEPPAEPSPPKIDMKQWVKEHEVKRDAASKSDQAASSSWNGWLVGGFSLAAVVTTIWLSSQRRF
jgi:hypothetical protein